MNSIGFPSPCPRPPMPTELVRASSLLRGSGRMPEVASATEPFAALLASKVDELAAMQTQARELVQQARGGQEVDRAEMLTAVQQSDLALSTLLQIRDKLIEAFREIQQIQI